MQIIEEIKNLAKTLEAGNYEAAPRDLAHGAVLQAENLATVMQNVCIDDDALILAKMIKVESCKSTTFQFNRQTAFGTLGGSAVLEGGAGFYDDSTYHRITVPMYYYSVMRRTTNISNIVETFDGVKADDRMATDAAKTLAFDFEFDSFRGMDDFSNAGTFDGNPLAAPIKDSPNLQGIGIQVRQSDSAVNALDTMMAEYGSSETVVLSGGGPLSQDLIEDMTLRAQNNQGSPEKLVVSTNVASGYNKLGFGKERIILAGSPQESLGSKLRKQNTTFGGVDIEPSQFLRGKHRPKAPRAITGAPAAPASVSTTVANASTTISGAVTAFQAGEVYIYTASAQNVIGESPWCATYSVTVAATGDGVQLIIAPGAGTTNYFNVYRTLAGGAAGTQKFVGRVIANGSSNVTFTDLGAKIPAFSTGFMVQRDTMVVKELMPYSRLKLAITDWTQPEAHGRAATLACLQPRKSVLADNLA